MTPHDNHQQAIEYLRCKMNPLYFIEKYIKIDTAGGPQPIAGELWHKTNKYRLWIKAYYNFKKTIVLWPRQTGKTTLDLAIDLWKLNFWGSHVGFISLDKQRVFEAIKRLKFMHSNLPLFLRTPAKKSTSERKTYFELENGGYFRTAYVSSATGPEQIFRGLSIPNLSIDELAFIPHADIMMGSIGPAYMKASTEAQAKGFPYGIKIFSTPNGAQGLFYDMYTNATHVEELLSDPDDPKCDTFKDLEECKKILTSNERNGFVIIKMDWREVFDEEWYEEQKRVLNFDKRKIAQEVDCIFLGSSNSIFDDEVFIKLKPSPIQHSKTFFNNTKLYFVNDINPSHTFIVGIDTAASVSDKSDYSAISIWDANDNIQVAEFRERIPVLKHFGRIIKEIINFLLEVIKIPEENLRLAIERNSYGLSIIEDLMYDSDNGDLYNRIIYESQVNNNYVPGIHTTAQNRPLIINNLIRVVNESPESIKGPILINELRTLVQKPNGRIEADKGFHDDLTFATAFAITVRDHLIKRGEIEIGEEGYKVNLDSLLERVVVQHQTKEDSILEPEIQIISETDQKRNTNDINKFLSVF